LLHCTVKKPINLPPASTKNQSSSGNGGSRGIDAAPCRVERKKWAFCKKKQAFRKKKRTFQNSGCNLQLVSLSSGNTTVVDCCAAKKTHAASTALASQKYQRSWVLQKYLRQPRRQLP